LLVRAFAAAVESLEGDESSAFCFVPHRGMITKRESASSKLGGTTCFAAGTRQRMPLRLRVHGIC
jgi:hypothetical protein